MVNAPLHPLESVAAPRMCVSHLSYLAGGVWGAVWAPPLECRVLGTPIGGGGVWAPLFLMLASLQLQRRKISEQEEMIDMWSNGIRGNVHRYQLIKATLIIELKVVYHLISCFLFFSWNWMVLV